MGAKSINWINLKRGGFFSFLLIFFAFISCDGQTRINGNIKDNNGRPEVNFNLGQAKKTIDSLKQVVMRLGTEAEAKDQEIQQLNNDVVELLKTKTELETQLSGANAKVVALTATIASLESQIANKNSKISELEASVVTFQNELDANQNQIADLNSQIETHVQTIAAKNAEIEAKNAEIQDMKDNPDVVHDTVYQERIVIQVPEPYIDTITTISDVIILDFTDSLVQPTRDPAYYVMVMGIGLVELREMDTSYAWQRHYRIERKVDYAEQDPDKAVTYRWIDLPFQIRDAKIASKTNNGFTVRVYATEQCKIQYAVHKIGDPGLPKIHEATSEEFNATNTGEYSWRHTRFIGGLEANTEYYIQVFVTSEKGHIDIWNLTGTTNP